MGGKHCLLTLGWLGETHVWQELKPLDCEKRRGDRPLDAEIEALFRSDVCRSNPMMDYFQWQSLY